MGHAFRLRPVELSDAALIVELRARSGAFLNPGASTVAGQIAWLEDYFERGGDFYFVVERADRTQAEGMVGLYGMDEDQRTAEWGRWVLRPGSSAAVESALLVYRCAFERLALERVRCRTLADNLKVVAFHDSSGLARAHVPVSIQHGGRQVPGVLHTLARQDWESVRQRLEPLAARVASAVRRSASPPAPS
jgi:RimJ/RimL family protein N-acetyltransferase